MMLTIIEEGISNYTNNFASTYQTIQLTTTLLFPGWLLVVPVSMPTSHRRCILTCAFLGLNFLESEVLIVLGLRDPSQGTIH